MSAPVAAPAAGLIASAQALGVIRGHQDQAVAKDVSALFAAHGTDAKTTHLLLPEILDQHAQLSSQITAQWYDDLDPGSKFRAKPYAEIPREQIAKTIDWAIYAPGEEPPATRLTTSSQRIVRNVGRQTVTRNAANEGVRWARYAQPSACAYCRALSMRGSGRSDQKWLYHSDKSAIYRKSDGEKYHDHCECEPIAVRGGEIWTPPEYTADWDAQYRAATKRVKTPRGDKDYFKHLVAQIRTDFGEHLVEKEKTPAQVAAKDAAAAAEQAAIDAAEAQLQETLAATAKMVKARHLENLDAAEDWREIAKIAEKILPDTDINFGTEISPPSLFGGPQPGPGSVPDTDVARHVVHAVDDVLTAFPDMRLEMLDLKQLPKDSTYAQEEYWPRLRTRRIAMNRHFTDDPALLKDSWDRNVADGFHHPGIVEAPAYNVIVHEMGHAMEDIGQENNVTLDHFTLMTALSDYFKATRPITKEMSRDGKVEFRQWLLAGLSGYSRADPTSEYNVALNTSEALAEAFADTFINGDNAQEPSKVLTKLLTDALAGVSYWEERYGAVSQAV